MMQKAMMTHTLEFCTSFLVMYPSYTELAVAVPAQVDVLLPLHESLLFQTEKHEIAAPQQINLTADIVPSSE